LLLGCEEPGKQVARINGKACEEFGICLETVKRFKLQPEEVLR